MTKQAPVNNSLRDRAWPRFLAAGDAGLLDALYVPALSRAVHYDRCCAYFSSRVLAIAARGFGGFIQNLLELGESLPRPAARLLVNEQLERADLESLQATGDQSQLIARLLKQFKTPTDALEKNRLQMLAWLVASGWLEVRVGLMRRTTGILHAKFGIVTDRHGQRLAFMGSDNETGQAITENYEELELRPDWQDPEFVAYYQQRFDRLWAGQDEAVDTLALPDAVRLKLIALAPDTPPTVEATASREAQATAMLWHYMAAAAYLPDGEVACDATAPVKPWPHQQRVVEDAARAFPAGRLLCDEVGMGKTIEAILTLRRLLAGRGVRRALLLPPAGLLEQWQDELREKGGLLVPRWENQVLYHPDGRKEKLEPERALADHDVLLLSREWARLEANRALVLSAPPWDLVLLDEAHAARRSAQDEREFNSVNLLLQLLRELQLRRRARAILLLSATPMQIQPWEPWDLLSVLGVGAPWLVEFNDVRKFYNGIGMLRRDQLSTSVARTIGQLVAADCEFPRPPGDAAVSDASAVEQSLQFLFGDQRRRYADWLWHGSPLARHMHRNTRQTLRRYHQQGMLTLPPPERDVRDEAFDYEAQGERDCYEAITDYIDERYAQLEKERPGKGFVMTVYRRRATSSPYALRCSLGRRLAAVEKIADNQCPDPWLSGEEESGVVRDLADAGADEQVDPGLPRDRKAAEDEKRQIAGLLQRLDALGAIDSKMNRFFGVLNEVRSDGRPVLVFTEYGDTMDYLRQMLRPTYGKTLACYSGRGGEVWDGQRWLTVSKAEISRQLDAGHLQVLICTDAASEGLNLQAAGALINYDLPWNPSRVEQRIGRIDRIGQQQREVLIRNMFLTDSVDMRVYEVLQERCGLFEHFVGRMQPILALARDALRRNLRPEQTPALIRQLEEAAQHLKDDGLVGSIFADSDAQAVAAAMPPVTRDDIAVALDRLSAASLRVKARRLPDVPVWRLSGLGGPTARVTLDKETLERDQTVLPLTAGSPLLQQIRDRLDLPPGCPLVLAEQVAGPYRCAEARWVRGDEIVTVKSAAQLNRLLAGWDGATAAPGKLLEAQRGAEKAARHRVQTMQRAAEEKEQAAMRRQLEAARRRLMRELGRTLRCLDAGDLDRAFRRVVEREGQPDGRYHRALQLLGGYPAWTADDVADANDYAANAKEIEKTARRAGSEIDAAIADPRWLARETLKEHL